ncbi:hypothetical protein ABTX71_12750 [Streptomyces parvulus]|uniref:hypothetical protein n=1 Tax=Streptomyces parvulus TaxID=146923 RepID=UPI003325DAD9
MTRAEAERLLGPAVVEAVRREVKDAPPLSTEQREQIRAVFAAAHAINGLRPAAKAA